MKINSPEDILEYARVILHDAHESLSPVDQQRDQVNFLMAIGLLHRGYRDLKADINAAKLASDVRQEFGL